MASRNPERDAARERFRLLVARRLAAVRQELDAQLPRFARGRGVDPNLWRHWEKGRHLPDPQVMAALCDDYGISMDTIYRGDLTAVRDRNLRLRLSRHHFFALPEDMQDPSPPRPRPVAAPADTAASAPERRREGSRSARTLGRSRTAKAQAA